jgi:hypothetical protein
MSNPGLSIDITTLDDSDLQKLLTTGKQTLLSFGSEIGEFFGRPISDATALPAVTFSISVPGSWKTSTGVGFTLKAAASCKIGVANKSAAFKLAKAIDSNDTTDITGQRPAGCVYINVEIDFDVQGNLSASGSVSGIGIAGKASGKGAATFTYCHPVTGTTETKAAILDAFTKLKFPFQPDSVTAMAVGAIGNVKFVGSFGLELDLSYGLGSYTVAAPGLSATKTSLKFGADRFTPSTLDVETGVKAAFTYTHAENYEAIVRRDSATKGSLFLSRSSSDDTSESLGVQIGVAKCTAASISSDPTQLGTAINSMTSTGGEQAASVWNDLQSSAVSKGSTWLGGDLVKYGNAGLKFTLDQQDGRALLYEFSADLTTNAIAQQCWSSFAKGDLQAAMRTTGLTLLPGSGLSNCMKRSTLIKLQFLNLFAVLDTESYFKNTYVSLAPDGSIRYSFDIGKEADVEKGSTFKKAQQKTLFHFVGEGVPSVGGVGGAEVDLQIEMSETNDAHRGLTMVASVAAVATTLVQAQLRQFLHDTPKGQLAAALQFAESAYVTLGTSSDQANWKAFQVSANRLMNLPFITPLCYSDWELFNCYSLYGSDPLSNGPRPGNPDPTKMGNPSAVPDSFYSGRNLENQKLQVQYFLQSSAQFMNLCAGLVTLARDVEMSPDDTIDAWNQLIDQVVGLVLDDVNADWSLPAASALLTLCGAKIENVDLQPAKNKLNYSVKLASG